MFPICEDLNSITNVRTIVPAYETIPKEFKERTTVWSNLISDWLFSGLAEFKVTPKYGVDPHKALEHIKKIMQSDLQESHKVESMAYLMSEWFVDCRWRRGYQEKTLTYK